MAPGLPRDLQHRRSKVERLESYEKVSNQQYEYEVIQL